ncbi:hypothetical protein ACJMK2_008602 [Sinanodonta woodiana]|uniref:Poly [ADP-ribose] polymerase n=1 Tax=Sinanodonta woodiana TaxID=1069815 RepID=A0ABD3VQ44_SINWO
MAKLIPRPYVLIQLRSGETEYENYSQELLKNNIKVTKIERLESKRLSYRFNSKLEEMPNHKPDFKPNIRCLYHCTCIEKSSICEEGLGKTMSRTGDFGNGFYFSDSPINCLYYSDFANHPERATILACLVVLGDCKIYEPECFDPSLTKAPEKETLSRVPRYYDSVMGSTSGVNQYVVYENWQVKVEYIITFAVYKEIKESIQIMPKADMSSQACQKRKASESKAWKYVAVGLGFGAVGFLATPLIAVAALGTVGFTSGGVAAGSIAAAIQSTIGNVAAGSAFAMAQSAAATGAVSVGTQLAGGTVLGTASAAVMKLFKKETDSAAVSQKKLIRRKLTVQPFHKKID